MEVFFLRLHMSELISSFFLVLGALMVWSFIHKKKDMFSQKWQKNIVAGFLMFAVTMIGMFAGLVLDKGHSWGNPAVSFALGTQHTYRMFTNDSGLLYIGLIYIGFQIIGAIAAFGVYIIYVWCYNFSTREQEKHIIITKIFKFDTTHPFNIMMKDALGMLIIAFVSIAGANMAHMPTAFPRSDLQVFATTFITSVAVMFVITTIGARAVLTMNPMTWAVAFVLKLFPALYLDRRSITWKAIGKELLSPIAVMGVAAVSGIVVSGILSLPFKEGPE